MNLTTEQKEQLARRIFDEFDKFGKEELEYQVEDMKDNDLLSWEYYLNQKDTEDITDQVIDMIAMPVV